MRTYAKAGITALILCSIAAAVVFAQQLEADITVKDVAVTVTSEPPRTEMTRCLGTPDEIVPVGDGQVLRYRSTKPEEMLRACALRIESDEVLAFVNRNGGVEELVFTRRSVRRQP